MNSKLAEVKCFDVGHDMFLIQCDTKQWRVPGRVIRESISQFRCLRCGLEVKRNNWIERKIG